MGGVLVVCSFGFVGLVLFDLYLWVLLGFVGVLVWARLDLMGWDFG